MNVSFILQIIFTMFLCFPKSINSEVVPGNKCLLRNTSLSDNMCLEHMHGDNANREHNNSVSSEHQRSLHPLKMSFQLPRGAVEEVYNLTFLQLVNGEASEIIVGKNESEKLCGYLTENYNLMPYSKGFTCTCSENDPKEFPLGVSSSWSALMKLPLSEMTAEERIIPVKFDPESMNENLEEFGETSDHSNISWDLTSPTRLHLCPKLQGVGGVYLSFVNTASRESFCSNVIVNRKCSHQKEDTVHCLHLSKLWYAVYQLSPAYLRPVDIHIQEREEDIWKSINGETQIDDSTFQDGVLDHDRYRLLVPQPILKADLQQYPELSGDGNELLLLDKEKISSAGDTCGVAGLGFEAFARQPARCLAPAGSCIGDYQPRALRRHDWEKRRMGDVGSYMLDNYADLPKQPLQVEFLTNQLQLVLISSQPLNLQFNLSAPPPCEQLCKEGANCKLENHVISEEGLTLFCPLNVCTVNIKTTSADIQDVKCHLQCSCDSSSKEITNISVISTRFINFNVARHAFNENFTLYTILLAALFLGIIKAVLGCMGCQFIEQFGFQILEKKFHPHNKNCTQNRCTKFVLNVSFLFVWPILILICFWIKTCSQDHLEDSVDSEEIPLIRCCEEDVQLCCHQFESNVKLGIKQEHEEEDKRVTYLCSCYYCYRQLNVPLGGVQVPFGVLYSVRGRLERCINRDYDYIFRMDPAKQFWSKTDFGWNLLDRDIALSSSEFTVYYKSHDDVTEQGELLPRPLGHCINLPCSPELVSSQFY